MFCLCLFFSFWHSDSDLPDDCQSTVDYTRGLVVGQTGRILWVPPTIKPLAYSWRCVYQPSGKFESGCQRSTRWNVNSSRLSSSDLNKRRASDSSSYDLRQMATHRRARPPTDRHCCSLASCLCRFPAAFDHRKILTKQMLQKRRRLTLSGENDSNYFACDVYRLQKFRLTNRRFCR